MTVLSACAAMIIGVLSAVAVPSEVNAQATRVEPSPALSASAQPAPTPDPYPQPVRVAANPAMGFSSPYFFFVPDGLSAGRQRLTILVVPNNTGKVTDDRSFEEQDALRTARRWRKMASSLHVALLVPAFPRPAAQKLVYTHALGRTAMTTAIPELHRLDLQLIAMIDDAGRGELAAGRTFDRRVLMLGFSASGMFTNRFVFMHPERVRAAAFGSPGGWAIAPVASWKGTLLPYPVGVADFEEITGSPFDLKAVAAVPQLLVMGDADQNDSVVYEDSYDPSNRKIIFDLFGSTLMARWPYTVEIYNRYLPNVELKLYPGVKHQNTAAMIDDEEAFFRSHLAS